MANIVGFLMRLEEERRCSECGAVLVAGHWALQKVGSMEVVCYLRFHALPLKAPPSAPKPAALPGSHTAALANDKDTPPVPTAKGKSPSR